MIYIISGVAKSGKTFVAKKITLRHQIPYFSTDYVMMMLFHGNKDLNININASDSSVSKQLEPYLFGLIKTMIENKVNYLIEGVHFNHDFASMLKQEFKHEINFVYLGYQFANANEKHLELIKYEKEIENKWYSHYDEIEMMKLLDYFISESKRIAKLCEEYDLCYIEVEDINVQLDDIINHILI